MRHKDFPDNWIYIHDPSVKVGRIQNFLSWSPEMAPAGYACLGLEYFCFEGDGLWTSKDEDLIELAKREIGQIGLIAPEDGGRRRSGAPAQGLSGLRRRLSDARGRGARMSWRRSTRPCTSSAATACTSTTTRTTP